MPMCNRSIKVNNKGAASPQAVVGQVEVVPVVLGQAEVVPVGQEGVVPVDQVEVAPVDQVGDHSAVQEAPVSYSRLRGYRHR